jgi:Fic family protein
VTDFRGRSLPEPAHLVGYATLIERYHLQIPLPPRLASIASRHHPLSTEAWHLFTPRHAPEDTLSGHLEFALKWEGVDLSVLAALFKAVTDDEIATAVRSKPTGTYARRLWYLHEWLTGRQLDIRDPGKVRAVAVVDPAKQFAVMGGTASSRHKVIDNLPGTRAFCPMVRRTKTLEGYEAKGLDGVARDVVGRVHADIMARAAAFLLLSDSKSSFSIEGERPSPKRAARWGQIIGEAGSRKLSVAELERLQRTVIGDTRFVRLGLRSESGFVGMHDRTNNEPLPDHISARSEDLKSLVEGVIAYVARAIDGGVDPVVVAAAAAFGFVYVHPFTDGNGRLHRWLIHHVLAASGYNPPGVIFPVSAAILRNIDGYRGVLESYSRPLLEHTDWRAAPNGNVEVLNDTADYYRYFDATAHAEFLYRCVEQTIEHDLPEEVAYLQAYDRFARGVQEIADMPSEKIELLHRFLHQEDGRLSKRARENEFAALTDKEAERIEDLYRASVEDDRPAVET